MAFDRVAGSERKTGTPAFYGNGGDIPEVAVHRRAVVQAEA